jgi:ATP-binding protein involved in chromosome partitioning
MSGRKLPDPKTVRHDVSPQVISSIGNYAIGIDWNDGHNSGIYSFNHLRSLGERAAGKTVEYV